jgi:tetratricopeptide (TPR) repeat protein
MNLSFGQVSKYFNSAEKAFENKNYMYASNLYTTILKEKEVTNRHYIFYKRAFCFYILKNYKKAKSDIKKAWKIKRNDVQYNWVKGNSCWIYARINSKLDKKKKSLKYLKKASSYIQSSLLYSTIGFKEIQLKQYENALININRAIQLDKTNAYAFSNRALVYIKLSELDKARADIIKSIQLDASNPYVYKHSAMVYIKLKAFEKACLELNKAKDLGYIGFGNESDSNDVENLIKEYCNSPANTK